MYCSKSPSFDHSLDHCVGLCEQAYRQNEDVMAFTARAFRTVFGVPDRPFQQ
jgi:hypothetical protein